MFFRPNRSDYNTDAEYAKALDEYIDTISGRLTKIADKWDEMNKKHDLIIERLDKIYKQSV